MNAYPGWGAYGLSKAALDHLSRTWAAELDGTGVRSISIDPGEMNTKMHADAIPSADPATLADPAVIAARIVALFAHPEALVNGARLEASSLSILADLPEASLVAGAGVTDLRLHGAFQLQIADGILTGIHDPTESHFDLLEAFAPRALLHAALAHAEETGYLCHEFGDSALILS